MREIGYLTVLWALFAGAQQGAVLGATTGEVKQLLEQHVEAWRGSEELEGMEHPLVLYFEFSDLASPHFFARLEPEGGGQLQEGEPDSFDLGYSMTSDFLVRMRETEMNGLTAAGRAWMSDPAPLEPIYPKGFEWTAASSRLVRELTIHFWNRQWPEVVPFNSENARIVHGAEAAVLYYTEGLRSAWFRLEPGMHINEKPEDQTNPFKSLVIVIKGDLLGRLDGEVLPLKEGEAVIIPAQMSHEFWVEEGTAEFILLMFGEGA